MAQKRTINVQFPRGGLSKRFAFQQQPPFTTLDAANSRPEGPFEKRLRGGSRPGLTKTYTDTSPFPLGSSNPIRLLSVMRSLNDEGRTTYAENFSGPLSGEWDAGAWNDGLIIATGGQGLVNPPDYDGAILKNGAGEPGEKLSADAPYTIECRIDPSALLSTDTARATVRVFARLDDTTPAIASCVYAQLELFLSYLDYRANLRLLVDNVEVDTTVILSPNTQRFGSGVLTLSISGNLSRALWQPDPGSNGVSGFVSSDDATGSSGKRVGIDTYTTEADSGVVRFDDFRLRYISSDAGIPPESVVASANGLLYRQNTAGAYSAVTQTDITLASDRALLAVDRLGKLYIADHGNRIGTDASTEARQTDGAVTSANADRLTSATIDATDDDWTEFGIEPDGDWLEIIAVGTGSAANKTAAIGLHKLATQSNAAYLELNTALSIDDDISGITFRVTRGPKVYDSNDDEMTLWEPTTGSIPLGCSILTIFGDRAVFGGDPEHPGIYYMGRSGNFLDFNYGASVTDRARAFADLTTTSDGGQLSIPLSAIAPITEDYAVFSAESELFLLRGDPTLGGIMANISSQIGIGSRTAYCRTPDGSLVFLSRDGLYKFHPSQPFPQSMSREKLPAELIDVVQNTDLTVTLEYDVRFRGVHIYITPATAGPTSHYWFDWETQSFWRVPLGSSDHEPFAITYDAKANHVLLGCRDGYIRHYSTAASDDDGTAISSHVLYGPINLGGTNGEGAVSDVYVVLDDASGDVVIDVLVGDDPESASKAAPFTSRTVSAGRSVRLPIRARGAVAFIRISDSGGSQWAIDRLTLVTRRHGKHR